MKNALSRILAILTLLALPATAHAQRVDQSMLGNPSQQPGAQDKIAAVVNENVVTTADIYSRVKLALLSAGLPDNDDVRAHLLPQVLRGLIDEQLQLQEAKRLEINVNKPEIQQTMERIAHDNNIIGGMEDYLKQHGASPEALEQQIRANLSWNKVIQRELRPRVEVGDDEVDAALERLRANNGKQEYLVSEIYLGIDSPKDEDQVQQLASNLVQQLKSGASFGAIAHQFSQNTSAAAGGDIGWVQEGQMVPEINKALVDMNPNQIAGPLRAASGFYIIGLREKRTITADVGASESKIALQQVFHPLDSQNDRKTVTAQATQIAQQIDSCDTLPGKLTKDFPEWKRQELPETIASKIPGWLNEKIHDLPMGKASAPIITDKGVLIMFVCGRHAMDSSGLRDSIMNNIGAEKIELQARRLMRDLRRTAYIDLRLGR